jgi:chemotaxis protein CheX
MTRIALHETSRLRLPAAMDMRVVESLTADLIALRGQAIDLDASQVERLGALGLQVLLSARLTWRVDKLPFAVVDPSEAFMADCALLAAPTFCDLNEVTPDD